MERKNYEKRLVSRFAAEFRPYISKISEPRSGPLYEMSQSWTRNPQTFQPHFKLVLEKLIEYGRCKTVSNEWKYS
jgi:hypothetical protein